MENEDKIYKGFWARLFCIHNYVFDFEYSIFDSVYSGQDNVRPIERVELYRCSKCGNVKKVMV